MGTGKRNYQAPEWITTQLLQDVLKKYFQDDTLEVRDLLVKCVTINGKSYAYSSELHRATFHLARKNETGKFSVIIKEQPKDAAGVNQQFKREILAYTEVLPRIESLLATIDDKTKIAPACYHTAETPVPYLILEDMELSGFENFEKGRLLNLDFALPTIEKLAKLHACSAVIAAEQPEIMAFFEQSPISTEGKHRDYFGFCPAAIRTAAAEVARWKGYEEITEKLFKCAEKVIDSAGEMFENHAQGFRVFNLADLWVDNLLFKINYDMKTAEDVVMVDFQSAYYGSPGIDLNHFLYGSVNENVRKVHLKFILHTYQKILQETMEKLKYENEVPTLKDISIEMIKNSLQGVLAAICITPAILSENENAGNVNAYVSGEDAINIHRENVENIKYRLFLQRTVKEFELNGFLDV